MADGTSLDVITLECRTPKPRIRRENWGQAVASSDESLFGPTSWNWDFGDGATSTERHPTHIYSAPGSYRVSLTVGNDHGTESVRTTVTLAGPMDINRDGKVDGLDTVEAVAEIYDLDGTAPEDAWRGVHRGEAGYAVRGGVFRSGQRPDLVAIWDGPRPSYVRGGTLRRFACTDPFLASVASPRFVRLSLCRGCGVGPGGPKPPLRGAGPGTGAHGNTIRSAGS